MGGPASEGETPGGGNRIFSDAPRPCPLSTKKWSASGVREKIIQERPKNGTEGGGRIDGKSGSNKGSGEKSAD